MYAHKILKREKWNEEKRHKKNLECLFEWEYLFFKIEPENLNCRLHLARDS